MQGRGAAQPSKVLHFWVALQPRLLKIKFYQISVQAKEAKTTVG